MGAYPVALQEGRVRVVDVTPLCCMVHDLGKSLSLLEPQLFCLQNGGPGWVGLT